MAKGISLTMFHKISLPKRPPASEPEGAQRREAERAILFSLVISLFLVFRSFPVLSFADLDSSDIIALASGLLPLAWGLVVQVLLLCKANGAVSILISQEHLFIGIALAAWSILASGADIALGRFPVPLYCSSLLVALLYWNRLWLLACLVVPPAVIAVAVMLFIPVPGRDLGAGAVDIGFSIFIAFAAAYLVKQDTIPSEERLRSLELENKELWNLSFRDGLTGLYNRRFAQETGQALFNRAARYHEEFHVLMIDIDHFKQVNDKLGHAVGDEVLKNVAEVIRANVRGSDIAARYGGEEFIIFVVRAEPELVQYIANRIRDGMASHVFPEVSWQVTVSIGVAGMRSTDTLEELVERADRNLYISKHAGRNRVSGF